MWASSRLRPTALLAFSTLVWALPGLAALDSDGDGIRDDLDNCVAWPNCDQRDTNSDGFGNRCDPDLDDNGGVGFSDYLALTASLGAQEDGSDLDLDGDGSIGIPDWSILRSFWGQPPGASGLGCAQGNFAPDLVRCEPHARNILVIVADDLGVDKIGAYDEHPEAPATPAIDSLAEGGVLFRNAWSDPLCSSTRAGALTGHYGFRTGVGGAIRLTGVEPRLGLDPGDPNAPILASLLRDADYETAAFGKWHVAGCPEIGPDGECEAESPRFDPAHPVRSGFDHFAGTMGNFRRGDDFHYCRWPKVEARRVGPGTDDIDVTSRISTHYATTETVDDAISHIPGMREPWFVWVAFNASHVPLHEVPEDPLNCTLPQSSPAPSDLEMHAAMTEQMDAEIGRLLDALGAHCDALQRTTIIFFADNGTDAKATTAPFDPERGKGTVYQGGIQVPFIVAGRRTQVPADGAESAALVNTTDVFATVMDLAGVSAWAEDSVSLLPLLENPALPSQRAFAYAERFHPNGFRAVKTRRRAIRSERYKLIHRIRRGPAFEFYDLEQDLDEANDLLLGEELSASQSAALVELMGELASLLGTPCLSLEDGDGDCVPDASDNCTLLPNAPNPGERQCDTNQDGFGNRCDADFDGDGKVGIPDQAMISAAYGAARDDPNSNWDEVEEMDLDCDGAIGDSDQRLFSYLLGPEPPGPSGLACAGQTLPCP
jgi:arylsulfatase A-like enzyme